MSQDHNHLNHSTWECKYHVVFTPMYRKEGAVWANQAALGHCIPRACPAQGMQDRRRTSDARPRAYADIDPAEIFGGVGDRVSEGEKLDLDCAECGTQILGEGLLRFDRRAGRGDDPRLHQKSGDRGQAVGSVATEARVLIKSRLLYQNPS